MLASGCTRAFRRTVRVERIDSRPKAASSHLGRWPTRRSRAFESRSQSLRTGLPAHRIADGIGHLVWCARVPNEPGPNQRRRTRAAAEPISQARCRLSKRTTAPPRAAPSRSEADHTALQLVSSTERSPSPSPWRSSVRRPEPGRPETSLPPEELQRRGSSSWLT